MNICAVLQMASSPSIATNLLEAERLIINAVQQGAKLVALPENFAMMGMNENDKVYQKETEGTGVIQDFLARVAQKYAVWVVAGTIPLATEDAGKIRAACLVYNPQGDRVARYDKIHLFDVSVPDTSEKYMESNSIEAGSKAVVIDTPLGKIGLTICYDLRFPELFRYLIAQGAEIIMIPSAFTAKTGKAHWEILLRARAIENLCYIIAPNQGGYHVNGIQTFGHSMIIDPWGHILNSQKTGSGVACANIDLEQLKKIRAHFPALTHRRLSTATFDDTP